MTSASAPPSSVLQAIYAHAQDAILLADDERRYVDANPAACALTGYTREELLARRIQDLTPPEDRAGLPAVWAEFRRRGKSEGDFLILRRDGALVPVHFSAVADILPGIHLSLLRDLSTRAAAEAELRAREERMRQILDNTTAVIYVVGADGCFISVNRAFERTFGVHREKLSGRTLEECFPAATAAGFRENNRRVLEGGTPATFEEVVPGPSGARTYLSLKFPIATNGGPPDAICGISTDISDRARTEAEIRQANERLAREVEDRTHALQGSLHKLSRFAATVAHDLRAPLRAMAGFGQILLNDYRGRPLDEEGVRMAERIVDGARRLDGMIHELLGYMSLEQQPVSLTRLDTAEVTAQALRELAVRLEWVKAEVEVQAPLAAVVGDAVALKTAVVKLVENAATFVAAGVAPRIRIRTEPRGERVRLWVEDNGIGILPEHQERIFGVFERLGRIEEIRGHGMGLAIARREVERQGGRIGVESQPGQGSRFWIELRSGEPRA